MNALELSARIESWPIRGSFTIARGSKREAVVVVATLTGGRHSGRGECVPYARYGATPQGVLAAILGMRGAMARGTARRELLEIMPPGAARNAIDCALWDFGAKASGVSAAAMAGCANLKPVLTAYTISLAPPGEMAAKAATAARAFPLLKLKLGGGSDAARIAAVRAAAPRARLIADANEGWSAGDVETLLACCADAGIELVEQPLPAGEDGCLALIPHAVPLCADESAHHSRDLDRIARLYDAVNIKLDKAGGLTGALDMAREAKARGLKIMAGCMVATSLAMAPAVILAQEADWVDLDGPLLLEHDREPGLIYRGARIEPPGPGLWG